MTIEQRVTCLVPRVMRIVSATGGVGMFELLREALLEVARDQRHTCAEAIKAIEVDNEDGIVAVGRMRYAAHQAVMNATIK